MRVGSRRPGVGMEEEKRRSGVKTQMRREGMGSVSLESEGGGGGV